MEFHFDEILCSTLTWTIKRLIRIMVNVHAGRRFPIPEVSLHDTHFGKAPLCLRSGNRYCGN